MLQTLTIKNLAVIDEARIEFGSGLNILSGETGAGKSIILQAISLILGGRASSDLIRKSCGEAVVEGFFDIRQVDWIQDRLDRHGLFDQSGELLIKRVLSSSGRHRVFINGECATLGMLQSICEGLIDLCGQHEHQSLIQPTRQIELLDQYGGLEKKSDEVAQIFSKARSLRAESAALFEAEKDREKRLDYLKFQLSTLDRAKIGPGEDIRLQDEKKQLQAISRSTHLAAEARDFLEGAGSDGALNALRTARQRVEKLSVVDPDMESLATQLHEAIEKVEEVDLAVNRFLDRNTLDANRMDEIVERLSLIADLKRKYGETIDHVLDAHHKLRVEFDSISNLANRMAEVQQDLNDVEKVLKKKARVLSGVRQKFSQVLSDSVTKELQDLNMDGAVFCVEVQFEENLEQWSQAGRGDFVEFLVRTNKGEEKYPLGRIASGGELSRMMLAIRRVISDRTNIGVYIFDEIDAGVGGNTAFQVGKKLKSVSKFHQIICITHLPQVASFADHHLKVVKKSVKGRTQAMIDPLDETGRREEIARMLGGEKVTKASIKNAVELMELAGG